MNYKRRHPVRHFRCLCSGRLMRMRVCKVISECVDVLLCCDRSCVVPSHSDIKSIRQEVVFSCCLPIIEGNQWSCTVRLYQFSLGSVGTSLLRSVTMGWCCINTAPYGLPVVSQLLWQVQELCNEDNMLTRTIHKPSAILPREPPKHN